MKVSNIIIVSDKKDVAKKIMSKIVLLRLDDVISVCSHRRIVDYVSEHDVDLILMYAENSGQTDTISQIKAVCKNTNVIIVSEYEDTSLICRAFDAGADDYISLDTHETLFLMRVMFSLRKKALADYSDKLSDILFQSKILDKNTSFYSKEYTNKIFDREYRKIADSEDENSYMMVVSGGSILSSVQLADSLKKIMRISDSAGIFSDDKIILILRKTTKDGVNKFFERLQNLVGEKVTLFASALNINKNSYSESLSVLSFLLPNAREVKNKIIFDDDKIISAFKGQIDINDVYNLAKKTSLKKVEKIIYPAFFKMSSIYEPKFFDTKVLQSVGKSKSSFTFKSNLCYAQVNLLYEDSTKVKIEIDCIFYGKENIEVCEINVEELNGELIEKIIQSVAARYRQALDSKE